MLEVEQHGVGDLWCVGEWGCVPYLGSGDDHGDREAVCQVVPGGWSRQVGIPCPSKLRIVLHGGYACLPPAITSPRWNRLGKQTWLG